jgi:hypothetical protein
MGEITTPRESTISEDPTTVPNSPEIRSSINSNEGETDTDGLGLIGELYPLNRVAKDAFHLLANRRHVNFYEHHCKFISIASKCFVFIEWINPNQWSL